VGAACQKYHDEHVRNIHTNRIQCDEIWSFVHSKQRNVPEDMRGVFGVGDVWTWVAIDADTKLVVGYMVGLRDSGYGVEFMKDVKARLANRVQLSTDAHKAYLVAVPDAFGDDIDWGQLVKIYGTEAGHSTRYSPPVCLSAKGTPMIGSPERKHISTSYIERQNLTMRMMMRRFTRLTNAFSKKVENHAHAIALHYMVYNYARVHQTLRVTPAMEAGLSDHIWEIEELVGLVG
jgi:IS1 family transposase